MTNNNEPLILSDRNSATPKLYTQCEAAYEVMLAEAEERHEGLIYIGSLTTLLEQKAGVGLGHYSHVVGKLRAMDCIQQLVRGGGGKGSQWLLKNEPTMGRFRGSPRTPGSTNTVNEALEQQVRDLSRRISALENQVEHLMKNQRSE